MMLYLSVVRNNDQLHIFGRPLRLPFMLVEGGGWGKTVQHLLI